MIDPELLGRVGSVCRTPVFVVTAAARGEGDGCLVGFATQCSIDPPRHLVCLSKQNRTYELAVDGDALAVHVLHRSHLELGLARLFGEDTGHEIDKLDRCEWRAGPHGVPVLDGCDWFGGPIVQRFDTGDHEAFVIDVVDGRGERLDEPCLSYADVEDLDAGHPA
jgi:flavin reductase (DIM6/NTAB) family NADH-FMN oxidoreductase RutF